MIRYKDVIGKLRESGFTTYRLYKERLLPQSTLTKLNNDQPVTLSTIDTICRLTGYQPGDLMEYVPDEPYEQ